VGDSVLRQLFVELWERVGFEAMFGAGDEGFPWVRTNEAVSSYRLGGGSRFEEERELCAVSARVE
jgi:hypothetical protein